MPSVETLVDHETVSRRAAKLLVERLREKPDLLLCVASGGTPTRTYELFVEACLEEPEIASGLRIIKLDEWGGLPEGHPATCEAHLRRALVDPLALGDRYVSFASQPTDPQAECRRIAAWLDENGPIDVAVLGLGLNGHLGFNEPAAELQPHAHLAALSETSLGHAMVRDVAERPAYGVTLGMADLFNSRQIVLIATGAAKREPLRRSLAGPMTTACPGSLLQLHALTTILIDAAASFD